MDDGTRKELDEFESRIARQVETALTGVGIQIGAVERVVSAKIGSVRREIVLALLGGQGIAALVTAAITKDWRVPAKPVAALGRLFGLA